MRISQEAICGTTEKSDALVRVFPLQAGREISFQKIPHPRFLERETELVEQILNEINVDCIRVEIEDYGALAFVLEARIKGAVILAGEEKEAVLC